MTIYLIFIFKYYDKKSLITSQKNTKKRYWEFLNSANLIKLEDNDDKEKVKKNLKLRQIEGQLEKSKDF